MTDLHFPWRRLLLCAAPLFALLAGCDFGSHKAAAPAVPTYTAVNWDALPATSDDDLLAGYGAWYSACKRLANDATWGPTCAQAPALPATPAQVRDFLKNTLQVYGLRSADKGDKGLITGYYEPVYPGSLTQDAEHPVPVLGVPDDLIIVALDSVYPELKGKRLRGRLDGHVLRPYDDSAAIQTKGVNAPVLAWLRDPMDLQFLQIQGSGRIQLDSGRQMRIGYADQNGYPYKPVGRWLVEQGLLKKEEVSMGRIRDWATANPQRVPELLASNPSYVFFSTRPDSNEGPRGSLNVPLTTGYSVAIDRKVIPLGSLLWLSTTRPDGTPINRPVAAQDTGGAIAGEVRADLFWGTGDAAGELAGNMKQSGQIWLLWPKGQALPGPH
ncbi:MAG: murein transglycosylase A [Pseudomonas sp.]|uniref:murein transglycosylase A n=1 Tax=Pseudomonas abieticivorans TaxID=2931382 RepID=UPI0020BF8D3B|nr:murein transglycosylase A [Pseudomonas sp. PIA16]MDE1167913.1 murein transglycosylase A [Pseudomonas sp.]